MSRLLQPADVAERLAPLEVDVIPAAEQNEETEVQMLAWLLSLRANADEKREAA